MPKAALHSAAIALAISCGGTWSIGRSVDEVCRRNSVQVAGSAPSGHRYSPSTADGGSTESSASLRDSATRLSPNAAAVSLTSRSTWIGPSALTPAVSTERTFRADFAAGSSSSTAFSPAFFGIHGVKCDSPSSAAGADGFVGGSGFTAAGLGAGVGAGGVGGTGASTVAVTVERNAATPLNDSTAAVGSCTTSAPVEAEASEGAAG